MPFSMLYGLVVWIRNALYDHEILDSTDFQIPIISVGNITVGGTGKTPHVEYLAGLLEGDYRVATLSRGYKRKTRDFRIAAAGSTVAEIGDEPLQIKQRFPGLTVAVDRLRVHGVRNLMELSPPVELILLDDAYQHRSLKPGVSILLIDFTRPLDRDHLLPAGMLREPASNRHRAQVILVTKSPENLKPIEMREYVHRMGLSLGQHLYFTSIRYDRLVPVYPGVPAQDLEMLRTNPGTVLLVAGIASPRSLRRFAESVSGHTSEMFFSDHHRYTTRDLDRISERYRSLKEEGREVLVLTTEKDAVRLRELDPVPSLREAFHAIRISVHFLNDDKNEFDQQILNYVKSNKRSSLLYQGADQRDP